MIINALNAIAEFLIGILKGLINFCEEFIPLLLKNALCISPFILSVVVAYKLGGAKTAAYVAVMVIVLIGVGISWAVKKKIQDRRLTGELITFILIIDVILVIFSIFQTTNIEKATDWLGRSKPQAVVDNRQEDPFANVPESFKIKEGEFLALLKDAISNDEYSDIIRSIDELKRMNCKSLKPLAISALEKYHSDARNEFLNSKYKVCVACIEALASINAKGACQVLYKVQARQPDLYNTVEKAAKKICK